MRFIQTLLTGAALVATALSQLTIDTYPTSVEAGKTYTVEYSPKDNTPTTFILRKGLSTNLDTVETLTTSATGGSFSWTVSSKYVDGTDYALEIRREGQTPNYSGQFPLTGGEGTLSSAISSARASASSAASAAISSIVRSASATISPSAGTNSTVSAPTLSVSRTSGTTRPTSSSSGAPPESTGAASSLATSPLAALFGAIAAFAYLA